MKQQNCPGGEKRLVRELKWISRIGEVIQMNTELVIKLRKHDENDIRGERKRQKKPGIGRK
jgi:hypothetical protein